jgi:pyrophosphatase PpaX
MSAVFESIEALVFDFDGTLIDASVPVCRSFNAALQQFGVAPLVEEDVRRLIGTPLRGMFANVLPGATEQELDELIAAYRVFFLPLGRSDSRPMPGLHPMLAHFHPRLKLGIATSRAADGARLILEHMGLLDRFAAVVGIYEVTHAKPHPEPVLQALAQLNVSPPHAVMVGDVPYDMEAARRAGVHAVGLVSELYPPAALRAAGADAIIQSLDELIGMVSVDAEP